MNQNQTIERDQDIDSVIQNFPWVFWISLRTTLYSKTGSFRGGNYLQLNWWVVELTIGQPWCLKRLETILKYEGDLSQVRECNTDNLKGHFFSFIVGKYKTIG